MQQVFHFTDLGSNKPTRDGDPYEYMGGFGGQFQSEIIPGTLPIAQNTPQLCRFDLYTECLTASAFGAPREANFSTWMYRCKPSCAQDGEVHIESKAKIEGCFLAANPHVKMASTQLEWAPFEIDSKPTDFIDGLRTVGGNGDSNLRDGLALHIYAINKSMDHRAFLNADGDCLFVAQLGNLDIQTELGKLFVQPGELVVIPRGIKYV